MSKLALPSILVALLLAFPAAAAACSTCYGAADSPMTQGMNNGILVLLACVGVMYVGFGKLFLDFRKRSKKLEGARPRLRLIQGGKP
jgi:hypothetical protein